MRVGYENTRRILNTQWPEIDMTKCNNNVASAYKLDPALFPHYLKNLSFRPVSDPKTILQRKGL